MLAIVIVLALITMLIVLFCEKKGSVIEMERYYQTHPTFQKYLSENKQAEKKNL